MAGLNNIFNTPWSTPQNNTQPVRARIIQKKNTPVSSSNNRTDIYEVLSGDTLSKLANQFDTTVQNLVKLNNIRNPNRLSIGLRLKVPKLRERKMMTTRSILAFEDKMNANTNENIINLYHANKLDGKYYLIDDKKNDEISLWRDSQFIKSYPALHATHRDLDEMTITYSDENGHIINKAGNMVLPAGLFFASYTGEYEGAPAFIRRTKQLVDEHSPRGIPCSIHRRNDEDVDNHGNSNGCTGMKATDLKDMALYIKPLGLTRVYILPSESRNKFHIRNGELLYSSHSEDSHPSYSTKVMDRPLEQITWKTDGLKQYQGKLIQKFARSIIDNKKALQEDLGINNDTYDKLAQAALGILGVETSYGVENSAIKNFFGAINKAVFHRTGPDYKSKYYDYKATGPERSVGLTLIREKYLNLREKDLMRKYNVTMESTVNDPAKAAILTMIKLGSEYLNTGNIDKAILSWNKRKNYVERVKNAGNRFTLYEKYHRGGRLIPKITRFIL